MSAPNTLAQVVAHAKSYGFVYPSSALYEGLQAVYDYGPYGVLLKRRLQAFWWQSMTQLHHNIVGLDAAILMHPRTWEASGHVAGFHDWMVDHKSSKRRYRVDVLLEGEAERWEQEGKGKDAADLLVRMHAALANEDGEALTALLVEAGVQCPVGKSTDWTLARKFNLMFATHVGAVEGAEQKIYLRPETAQGIFVNFLHVQQSTRKKVPFGIAQIGKAFRNEVVARQFTFRMREFEQMEMQFFVPPGDEDKWFAYWQKMRLAWYGVLGFPPEVLHVHPHEQLAHYARAAVDLTYAFPFGWREVEGIHSRTDFDLRNHAEHARKKMHYFDPYQNKSYIPYVIETSVGCDRLLLMLLCQALREEEGRTWLALPPALAPMQAAVLPLLNKEPLTQRAEVLLRSLQPHLSVDYQATGSIGKRYARQDLLGTPYCVTVDYHTLEDDTVTLRLRDTMGQHRLPIAELLPYLQQHASIASLLTRLPTMAYPS